MYIDGNTPISQLYHTDDNAELSHAWLKKGEQADEHKYIRREWKNGRWVYYYADGSSSLNRTRRDVGNRFKSTANNRSLLDKYRDKHKRAVAAAKKKVQATGGKGVVESNDLLSSSRTITDSSGVVISRTYVRGKLERAMVAGEAYIDYLFNGE